MLWLEKPSSLHTVITTKKDLALLKNFKHLEHGWNRCLNVYQMKVTSVVTSVKSLSPKLDYFNNRTFE